MAAAAGLVAQALPVTVGVLAGPPGAHLEPLIATASLTLAAGGVAARAVVPMAEISGAPDLDGAVKRLRAAVAWSPRAAVACGQLLRQTAGLGTVAGLAAEAAAYSTLLGGPEVRALAGRARRAAPSDAAGGAGARQPRRWAAGYHAQRTRTRWSPRPSAAAAPCLPSAGGAAGPRSAVPRGPAPF